MARRNISLYEAAAAHPSIDPAPALIACIRGRNGNMTPRHSIIVASGDHQMRVCVWPRPQWRCRENEMSLHGIGLRVRPSRCRAHHVSVAIVMPALARNRRGDNAEIAFVFGIIPGQRIASLRRPGIWPSGEIKAERRRRVSHSSPAGISWPATACPPCHASPRQAV